MPPTQRQTLCPGLHKASSLAGSQEICMTAGHPWLTSVILATQEAEIRSKAAPGK
jgi:hypothetical protein